MTVDATANITAYHLSPMPDGRVIIGGVSSGQVFNFDGSATVPLGKYPYCPVSSDTVYCVDGSRDTNHLILRVTSRGDLPPFNSPSYAIINFNGTEVNTSDSVRDIKVQPDSKVLYSLGSSIHRLLSDGSADASFPTINGRRMLMLPDGRFLTDGGGSGVVQRYAVNGSIDGTFFTATLDGDCYDLALAPDGNIVITGTFSHVNGSTRANVARLFPDGTLDFSFRPFTNATLGNSFMRVGVQSDGRVIWGSDVQILRINSDGTLDKSFRIVPRNVSVYDMCLDTHDRVIYSTSSQVATRLSARTRVVATPGIVPLVIERSDSIESGWSVLFSIPAYTSADFIPQDFPGAGNSFFRIRPAS